MWVRVERENRVKKKSTREEGSGWSGWRELRGRKEDIKKRASREEKGAGDGKKGRSTREKSGGESERG